MRRVRLSPKAKSDINSIWDYTYDKWGQEQAEKYVCDLWDNIQLLKKDLSLSCDINNIRVGYKKIRSGSHVVFFKVTNDDIDVIRILHKQMDFDRHL